MRKKYRLEHDESPKKSSKKIPTIDIVLYVVGGLLIVGTAIALIVHFSKKPSFSPSSGAPAPAAACCSPPDTQNLGWYCVPATPNNIEYFGEDNKSGTGTCTKCSPGSYVNSDGTGCSPCLAGTAGTGYKSCAPCPTEQFAPAGSTECKPFGACPNKSKMITPPSKEKNITCEWDCSTTYPCNTCADPEHTKGACWDWEGKPLMCVPNDDLLIDNSPCDSRGSGFPKPPCYNCLYGSYDYGVFGGIDACCDLIRRETEGWTCTFNGGIQAPGPVPPNFPNTAIGDKCHAPLGSPSGGGVPAPPVPTSA